MQGYTETILKYASDDTRTGILKNPDGTGEVGLTDKEVGKRLAVRFTLSIGNSQIEKIRFQVFGCGFTIAACAAVAEIAEGIPVEDASSIDSWAINNRLKGLPDERSYCAELAVEAFQAALVSSSNCAQTVEATLPAITEEHGSKISPDDPLYSALMKSSASSVISEPDRQMFAGLLTVASQERWPFDTALGLDQDSLATLLATCFPDFDLTQLTSHHTDVSAPETNNQVLDILLSHVPTNNGGDIPISSWLAHIIAARASHSGHLWTSMGFIERPELTAAIRRHLPTLATANNQGMRWKRYLFKQVCDMNGKTMCKSPNCGDCSDYAYCFATENEKE